MGCVPVEAIENSSLEGTAVMDMQNNREAFEKFALGSLSDTDISYITDLIAQRKNIQAIKELRKRKPMGLKEAKDAIEGISDYLGVQVTSQSDNLVKTSRCFVATACYGNCDHPDVITLRNFRDQRLMTTPTGRFLVSCYYRLSPPVASWLSKRPGIAGIVRERILRKIVSRL